MFIDTNHLKTEQQTFYHHCWQFAQNTLQAAKLGKSGQILLLLASLRSKGLLGVTAAKAHGGLERSYLDHVLAMQAIHVFSLAGVELFARSIFVLAS